MQQTSCDGYALGASAQLTMDIQDWVHTTKRQALGPQARGEVKAEPSLMATKRTRRRMGTGSRQYQVSGARWFVPSEEAAVPKHPGGESDGAWERAGIQHPRNRGRRKTFSSTAAYLLLMTLLFTMLAPAEAVYYELNGEWHRNSYTRDQWVTWASAACTMGVACYCGQCTWTDGYGSFDAANNQWQGYDDGRDKVMGAGSVLNPMARLNAWITKTPRQKNRRLQRAKYRHHRD